MTTLSEIELSYWAALVDGLRVIDESGRDAYSGDIVGPLLHYVRSKGKQIHVAFLTTQRDREAAIQTDAQKIKGRCGRRGLPEPIISAMIDEYRRTDSLSQVGAKFGRSRQSVWQILHRRIELNSLHPKLHEPVFYGGRKFTPGKGGYLRLTTASARSSKEEGLLHRIVWVDHYEMIPPGHQVMFRDGNRLHCDIGNLFLASRRDAPLGKKSSNAWTKYHRDQGPRPMRTAATRAKHRKALQSVWATYTPEQKDNRLRGIHRRWNERRAAAIAA